MTKFSDTLSAFIAQTGPLSKEILSRDHLYYYQCKSLPKRASSPTKFSQVNFMAVHYKKVKLDLAAAQGSTYLLPVEDALQNIFHSLKKYNTVLYVLAKILLLYTVYIPYARDGVIISRRLVEL